MRKLNLSYILLFLVSSIALAGGLYFLHSFQMSRNSQTYVRAAKRAQEEKRFDAAVAYLRRYILLAPKDPEGLILFGSLLQDLGRPDQAYLILERALELAPDRTEVRRKVVVMGLQLGRYNEAAAHLEEFLLKETPNDGEALSQLSTCHFATGRYEDAEKTLDSSIVVDPSFLKSYTMLASLRREKLNRAADAMDVIDLMVTQNSDKPLAYFYRAQWLAERLAELTSTRKKELQVDSEMLAQAQLDINQALKLAPDHANSLMLAIHLASRGNRIDEIRGYAEHGIKVHPGDHRFYLALAELERLQNSTPNALEVLVRGAAALPENLPIKWALADVSIELGKYDEAASLIGNLEAAKYRTELIAYLEAKSAVYRQDWLTAIDRIESFRVNLRDRPELLKNAEYWLGMAQGETLSVSQQINSLRRAVALDPEFIKARLELANTLSKTGSLSEAITEYEQLLASPSAPVLAAVGLANSLLAWNLNHPAHWDDFDRVLARMEGEESLQDQVALLRMEKLLAIDDVDAAEKIIAEALKKNVDRFELWQAQISLALRQKNWEEAERLIESCKEQLGDTVLLRLLKARYIVQRQGPEMRAELSKITEVNPMWSDVERRQLFSGLAPLFSLVGDYATAERLGLEVAAAEPRNLPIRLTLLDIAVAAKRPDLMATVLEELKNITGEKAVWHFGKALYLTLLSKDPQSEKDSGQLRNEALAHLKKAKATAPNWSRIPLLSGDINEQLGDFNGAVEYYLEAIRLGERSSDVSGRALTLLFKQAKFDAAANLLSQLKESHVSFTEEMHRAEVDVALQLGRSKDALKATEDLVRASQESVDPVWLGQVYATLGKYDQAESQFRQAIESNKNDPRPWVGLVKAAVMAGKKAKVDAIIAEEELALTGEDASLTIGVSYELSGKPERARAVYQAAYDKSPENVEVGLRLVDFLMKTGAFAPAEITLRKLIKVVSTLEKQGGKPEQAQLVEQKLARALMGIGGQDRLGEALGIVERHLVQNPNSADDARLKAIILANTPSSIQQKQAIAILENLLSKNPSPLMVGEDRYLLARLYDQTGDRVKARNELKKLITTQKDDPRFYNAYAQLSLQAGEVTEAELYLGILQKLAPMEISTTDLESQILFRKEKYSEVIRLLKGIGASRSRDPAKLDSAVTTKLWAAKSLEEFGRQLEQVGKTKEAALFTAETETLYKQYIEERPEEMLALAEFLAQSSEADRALDLLQEHGAKSTPVRVASVALAMMKNPHATPSQLARLQSLIDENVKSHADSPLIPLLSADLNSWRGEYGEALNSYRSILLRDGKSVPALNNLAVLLALTGGDYNEALGLIQRAIDQGGPVSVLLDSRGIIHLSAGHPEIAINDFESAVSQRETAERRFHVARAYLALKQTEPARQSIKRAEQLALHQNEIHPLERPYLKELKKLLEE